MANKTKLVFSKTVPVFVLVNEESEPMTTDCMVEEFDMGEHTEADLDRLLAHLEIGQEIDLECHYYENADDYFIQTIKRVE